MVPREVVAELGDELVKDGLGESKGLVLFVDQEGENEL